MRPFNKNVSSSQKKFFYILRNAVCPVNIYEAFCHFLLLCEVEPISQGPRTGERISQQSRMYSLCSALNLSVNTLICTVWRYLGLKSKKQPEKKRSQLCVNVGNNAAKNLGLSSRSGGSSAIKSSPMVLHKYISSHLTSHWSKTIRRSWESSSSSSATQISFKKCHTYSCIDGGKHAPTLGELMVRWVTYCTSHATILNEFLEGFSFITT